jgi:flagellar basal-body rod protein FlgF
MKGNAWLAVQGLDGTEAYTRAGALDVTPRACWSPAAACRWWATAGRSPSRPMREVQIGGDGTVTATVGSGAPQGVGRLKLVTPEAPLQRGADGLFRAAEGDDLPADATAGVQPGRWKAAT